MNIVSISENTIMILFEQTISHTNFLLSRQITRQIKTNLSLVIVDIIPSYASIHITFNLLKISLNDFKSAVNKLLHELSEQKLTNINNVTIIKIPVYYGMEVALDLPIIAAQAQLTANEVIAIHTSKIYNVYAIGFAPGFAYLGDVDNRICTPRKPTPRKKIAQGSVGIADQQTAIYPADSPGGWQIIGKTPMQMIDYDSKNLVKFTVGDKVKFTAISKDKYLSMQGKF